MKRCLMVNLNKLFIKELGKCKTKYSARTCNKAFGLLTEGIKQQALLVRKELGHLKHLETAPSRLALLYSLVLTVQLHVYA